MGAIVFSASLSRGLFCTELQQGEETAGDHVLFLNLHCEVAFLVVPPPLSLHIQNCADGNIGEICRKHQWRGRFVYVLEVWRQRRHSRRREVLSPEGVQRRASQQTVWWCLSSRSYQKMSRFARFATAGGEEYGLKDLHHLHAKLEERGLGDGE